MQMKINCFSDWATKQSMNKIKGFDKQTLSTETYPTGEDQIESVDWGSLQNVALEEMDQVEKQGW